MRLAGGRRTRTPIHTDVVLVRHASSVPPTADGPGPLTRPLTPDGLRQAVELVPELVEPRPVAVWSSPYRRAVQTVVVASHGTFLARTLGGFGRDAGWDFWRRMPMPAVYRLRFDGPAAEPVLIGPESGI